MNNNSNGLERYLIHKLLVSLKKWNYFRKHVKFPRLHHDTAIKRLRPKDKNKDKDSS